MLQLPGTPVRAWWGDARLGDQRRLGDGGPWPVPEAPRRLARIHQVHGADVVAVGDPVPAGCRAWEPGRAPLDADALVSSAVDTALCVLTADCGPVALGSPQGLHGAVHVGWRGLQAGVVEAAVGALRTMGADPVVAAVGPAIGPCCYEFSAADLDTLAARYGDGVRAHSARSRPALDLVAGIAAAVEGAGATLVATGCCTGCSNRHFSHRVRRDQGRQAMLVWRPTPRAAGR